jgi:hypothetical protein
VETESPPKVPSIKHIHRNEGKANGMVFNYDDKDSNLPSMISEEEEDESSFFSLKKNIVTVDNDIGPGVSLGDVQIENNITPRT